MKSLRSTLHDLNRITTIEELPHTMVSTFATALLCYLCVLPVVASVTYQDTGFYISDGAPTMLLSAVFPYGDHWYRLEWSVLILSLLFVAYAAAMVRKKLSAQWLRDHRAIFWFGALFLLSFFSFLQSANRARSFWGTGYRHDGFLTYCFFLSLFCTAIQLEQKQIRAVLEVFAAVGTLLGLLCIFPALTSPFTMWGESWYQSIFCQKTHYGGFLSLCVPVGMTLFLTDDSSPLRLALRLAQLWVLFNSLVFNATRAAVVGIAVVTVLFHVALRGNPRLLLMDALLVATVLFLHTNDALLNRTAASMLYAGEVKRNMTAENQNALVQALDRLTSGRYTIWGKAVEYALRRPLLGWGPDNLGELYYADGFVDIDRPHNEFLQIAASLGIPALLCYLLGLWNWARPHLRRGGDPLKACLFLVGVSYLVCSVFSNSMYYTTPYFYMILGFSYQRCSDEKKQARVALCGG